jgi:hypothetical protein
MQSCGVVASSPGGVLTTIQATFYLGSPEFKLGKYTLVVNNPDGQYAWLDDKFEITVPTSPPSAPAPSMGGPPPPGAQVPEDLLILSYSGENDF